MTGLSTFERQVLKFILETEEFAYLDILDELHVKRRSRTGMGVFVDFAEHQPIVTRQRPRRYGNAVAGIIKESDDVVRFDLISENGQLLYLEIFSNDGHELPESLDHVRLERIKTAN